MEKDISLDVFGIAPGYIGAGGRGRPGKSQVKFQVSNDTGFFTVMEWHHCIGIVGGQLGSRRVIRLIFFQLLPRWSRIQLEGATRPRT